MNLYRIGEGCCLWSLKPMQNRWRMLPSFSNIDNNNISGLMREHLKITWNYLINNRPKDYSHASSKITSISTAHKCITTSIHYEVYSTIRECKNGLFLKIVTCQHTGLQMVQNV